MMLTKKKTICPYCGMKEMVKCLQGGRCLVCKKKMYSAKFIKSPEGVRFLEKRKIR